MNWSLGDVHIEIENGFWLVKGEILFMPMIVFRSNFVPKFTRFLNTLRIHSQVLLIGGNPGTLLDVWWWSEFTTTTTTTTTTTCRRGVVDSSTIRGCGGGVVVVVVGGGVVVVVGGVVGVGSR